MANRIRKTSLASAYSTSRKLIPQQYNHEPTLSSKNITTKLSSTRQLWRASTSSKQTRGNLENYLKEESKMLKLSYGNLKDSAHSRINRYDMECKRKQIIFEKREREEEQGFNNLCRILGIWDKDSRRA